MPNTICKKNLNKKNVKQNAVNTGWRQGRDEFENILNPSRIGVFANLIAFEGGCGGGVI